MISKAISVVRGVKTQVLKMHLHLRGQQLKIIIYFTYICMYFAKYSVGNDCVISSHVVTTSIIMITLKYIEISNYCVTYPELTEYCVSVILKTNYRKRY